MRVKVCGITCYEDAAMALDLGVDALGFNFFPSSPRYIAPEAARSIIRRLPPFAVPVGLFVNVADPQAVKCAAQTAGVQVLQFHGDESSSYCGHFPEWLIIKVLRIGTKPVADDLKSYPVRAFLLDSQDAALFGGTGKAFDWRLVQDRVSFHPIILAGGLSADNVGQAIRIVKPYAVDVCSGVEICPGKKDFAKLGAFMNEVRNADRSL
jgi:phosphoribosylanthranilate isomerase